MITNDALPVIGGAPYTESGLIDTYDTFIRVTGLPARCAMELMADIDEMEMREPDRLVILAWLLEFIFAWDACFNVEEE